MRVSGFPLSQQRLVFKLQREYWSGDHKKKIVESSNTLPLICFKNWIAASSLAAAFLNIDESSCGSSCFRYILQLNFNQGGPVFCGVVLASLHPQYFTVCSRQCVYYSFKGASPN